MHRELEWPVSKATCLYAHLYMVYRHLYKIIEGTSAAMPAAVAPQIMSEEVPAAAKKRRNSDPLGARLIETKHWVQCVQNSNSK